MGGNNKTKWLQVRMSGEEKDMVDYLAKQYGMDTSTFIRAIVVYFDQTRPNLVIVPEGKGFASTLTAANR